MKELITSKIEEVRYNGGHSTRKPSTVTMAVPHKFAVQVAEHMEEYQKKGIEPDDGLIRLDLVAHYADLDSEETQEGVKFIVNDDLTGLSEDCGPEGEQIIDDLEETVDEALDETIPEEDTNE